jgi:hypothetical protein
MSSKKKGSLDNLGEAARLIDAYIETSEGLTQQQLGRMECQIWDALPGETRRQWRRSYFFQEVFGGTTSNYELRQQLSGLGDNVAPLWKRIEPGYPERISLKTAVVISKEARTLYRAYPEKYPRLADALVVALEHYEALPIKSHMPDGTIVRKKATAAPPSRRQATKKAKESKKKNGDQSPKEFYREVRELVARHVAERLEGVGEELAEHIYADFEVELKIVIRMLQERLHSAKKQLDAERKLSDRTRRSHVRDDFMELGMDPPKPFDQPDFKKIRSQYRALARAYHPDKQPPGAPDLSSKFQAATEAYNRIVAYYRDKGIT